VSFAAPDLLWLALLAPAAALLAAWLWRRRLAADAAWAARGLWDRLFAGYSRRRLAASVVLLAAAVLATGLALARPRWGAETREVERRGVDVVFVLDSSLSMAARDVAPSRLAVAKSLVRRLVRDMPGNRVALVQGEGDGLVMAPLTLDGALLDLLLDAVEPGSLPVPGTELAPSLTRALDLFAETRREHRVMVLLTDGEDHGGHLQAALDRLRREGVAVHAIGVGTPQGAPVPLPDDPRRRDADAPGYKRDGDGQVVISRLGETVLEEIAAATGGVYVRATSAAADVEPIERHIRDMATRTLESETVSTLEERFQWPLGAAALLLALQLALGAFRRGARRAAPAVRGSAP
jgi:Ca-activated chloride channel family protein